jgi:hypothetical protein
MMCFDFSFPSRSLRFSLCRAEAVEDPQVDETQTPFASDRPTDRSTYLSASVQMKYTSPSCIMSELYPCVDWVHLLACFLSFQLDGTGMRDVCSDNDEEYFQNIDLACPHLLLTSFRDVAETGTLIH